MCKQFRCRCLRFLRRWCHDDEDMSEHNYPDNQDPGLTTASSPSYSTQHQNETYYPAINEPAPKLNSEPFNGAGNISKGENRFANGVIVNREKSAKDVHPKMKSGYHDEDEPSNNRQIHRSGLTTASSPSYSREPQNGTYYPPTNKPPPKLSLEPFTGTENISKGENRFASDVAVNGKKLSKDVHSNTALNGEVLKTVHPRSKVPVPHVGNNSTSAAPVQQKNLMKDMRKDDEEEEDQ